MSFSDRPTFSGWQLFGCLGVGLVGAGASFVGLIVAGLGHCVPEPDGTGCENVGLVKFFWFPGIPLLFLALGIGMMWLFARSRR